ncbi:hypothetical protein RRG08_059464 [Elysia crispata]|uniref:Uncharacterized protein n=1 Tax=Elysia crispata TaxID=231223 RepID=A0AAE1A492_9GAST|nr:hypothetical protein RRG08_059464 [Elysia crispata]
MSCSLSVCLTHLFQSPLTTVCPAPSLCASPISSSHLLQQYVLLPLCVPHPSLPVTSYSSMSCSLSMCLTHLVQSPLIAVDPAPSLCASPISSSDLLQQYVLLPLCVPHPSLPVTSYSSMSCSLSMCLTHLVQSPLIAVDPAPSLCASPISSSDLLQQYVLLPLCVPHPSLPVTSYSSMSCSLSVCLTHLFQSPPIAVCPAPSLCASPISSSHLL